MGVPVGESEGDLPVRLQCRSCGDEYETDETMTNECPFCGAVDYDAVGNEEGED